MDSEKALQIRQKIRQRFLFSGMTLVLYFAFALNWTDLGSGLREPLGDSSITGSLLFFVLLIVVFIGFEILFIRYSTRRSSRDSFRQA